METPVVLQMLKANKGFYFYFYAKNSTICTRKLDSTDLEAALSQVEPCAKAHNLKIVDRLPLLDHTNLGISIDLGDIPNVSLHPTSNDRATVEFKAKLAEYNGQLVAAFQKL